MSLPSVSKREPWQGQSQLCSRELYFRAQPMWGQRGTVGVSRLAPASRRLDARGSPGIRREGENRAAQGFSRPCTRSASSRAAVMAEVMPHLLKPVAVKSPAVPPE